jgi:predicted helicase
MTKTLRELLALYRDAAVSEREKGTYFENLTRVWLENAPLQKEQFKRVMTYADFAKERGIKQTDGGIDLVAQLAEGDDDWCAIQCKFYRHGYKLQKSDIDSFFTASGKVPFTRRMIVETTGAAWGKMAEDALDLQNTPVTRISMTVLEDSGLDWGEYSSTGKAVLSPKKQLRADQRETVDAVIKGLAEADRGKLIMACGTGKTFTSLKIAENLAGRGGRVLFLVPSLALMAQTVREWSLDSEIPLRSFAVCSDTQVGVNKANPDDLGDTDAHDLEIPATTWSANLAKRAKIDAPERMTVVFATYQSIQVINAAQEKHGLPPFDLIVCDEAHRTTGATLADQDESNFVRIHDNAYVAGKKRVYMTATPRIFGEALKKTAAKADALLCSMDDEGLYGKVLMNRTFSWAVEKGLLTDYKVIVLAVDEGSVSASLQKALSDENSELKLDDATKLVGCYRALTKMDLSHEPGVHPAPMKRAIAFAKTIAASKTVAAEFGGVGTAWRIATVEEAQKTGAAVPPDVTCKVRHVDGTYKASERGELLAWLKEETGHDDECRILTNARCLSEGVDVPALDAIMFLHPRKSIIDVVQSVGRVMRRAPGKTTGYVILPVGVPAGMAAEEALSNNSNYAVVWQILNALRSHDDRLDATINKISLGVDPGDRIGIVAVSNTLPTPATKKKPKIDIGSGGGRDSDDENEAGNSVPKAKEPDQLGFQFDDFAKAILARIVKKCGTRAYLETWAEDIARIAQIHITRITAAVAKPESAERTAFDAFLAEIRDDLNDAISQADAIEMLAQHLITRPVFDALFEGYEFAANNPVSKALEGVLSVLDRQHLEKETESLEKFYASVRMRASGIEDAGAKQKIVVELYDTFFRKAFPRMTQKLGIVYTPVEVVDFIIHSVDQVLQSEFGQSLTSEGVHIIDPFTGTGTFITRLLQSGLIKPEDMERKFTHEIHANEIVLLAYYIAAINIEAVYHSATGNYAPFPGICLTDTFAMYEKGDMISDLMTDNSERRTRQKNLPIKVIIGNPPYSVGQTSANDDNANVAYESLDERLRETYVARSVATNKNALYDSYIRAIRWASDRVAIKGGVVAFVTNAGWIDASTADGLRKCFAEEFTSVSVFHLRGNQRTQGEQSRREGGKIFGEGSRAPVAITVLVNNPASTARGAIRIYDIGDYLTREEKLSAVSTLVGINGIEAAGKWETITPDDHGDWLNQRDDRFDRFIVLGDKDKTGQATLFDGYSIGVKTQRDAWAVNPSRMGLLANMGTLIATYEAERARYLALGVSFDSTAGREAFLDGFVTTDGSRISWSRALKADIGKNTNIALDATKTTATSYRPFTKQWLYFDRKLNEMVYQIPRIFPVAGLENRTISVSGIGARAGFAAFMLDAIPNLHTIDSAQNFPRYLYEPATPDAGADDLFGQDQSTKADAPQYNRKDAITDAGLKHFADAYPGETINKDDIFHYVYGILHSEDYRARYADNLTKQLPRIPLVKSVADFWAFVDAGVRLGDLHVNYESVAPYPVTIKEGDLALANIPDPVAYFRVEKMKYGGKRPNTDKTTVHYNIHITLTGIPLAAYDYVVNGKAALDWVIDRQCVKTDKDSGIVSDANAYANETIGDPRYPFDLFCRVITVSLETMKVVNGLPALDIREG